MRRTDGEIQRRADVKEVELRKIFETTKYKPAYDLVHIGVLGCGDYRFIYHHKCIFEKLLQKPIQLTTFDITIEHLQNEEGVVQHDCTLPLHGSPYDITYGHALLRFIETEKQWDVLKNSYEVLRSPGLAIHVFDEKHIMINGQQSFRDYWLIPFEFWKKKLSERRVKFIEIHWTIKFDYMIDPIHGVRGGALVLIK